VRWALGTPPLAPPPAARTFSGHFIASGGAGGEVRVWDVASREMVTHLKFHSQAITDMEVRAGGGSNKREGRSRHRLPVECAADELGHVRLRRMDAMAFPAGEAHPSLNTWQSGFMPCLIM
jgi:hypothetical protein